jgi:fumarylacetoacetase
MSATVSSWVDTANDGLTHFPLQNLPYGVFSRGGEGPRVGVALGEYIVDLDALDAAGLLPAEAHGAFAAPTLNRFIALGQPAWAATRARLTELLTRDHANATLRDNAALRDAALVPMAAATLHLPVDIPGYTDFYSSREHATNVGSLFRDPANALLPNWLEIPIGYNGRASSVVVSGTDLRRPNGQVKLPDAERPEFGPSRKLDYELEMAFIVGRDSMLGEPVEIARASDYLFGMVILNDWSARDIQQWEYVPLGPFNAKSFGTSISPWVVPMAALEPFRRANPAQSPGPLPYLRQSAPNAYDIELEVALQPAGAAQAQTVSHANFRALYWTMAQQLAHHTVSGCNVRVGDLMGSGTISGTTPGSQGSLLELTRNGAQPLTLGTVSSAAGIRRGFLEDGDQVIMTGWCQGDGYRVGFGEVSGTILPALPAAR